jgi:cell fate regulator YaaT (PSP1 superfamily)
MACGTCASGEENNGVPKGCQSNGACGTDSDCGKLDVFDWLADMELPSGQAAFDILEIRFKNSRKEFYRNVNNLPLQVGDVIAVESSPGHDIGVVSIVGELARLQLKKKGVKENDEEIKKIYRKAKDADIETWKEAQELEKQTMYRARTIAVSLALQMKISDVEYQGDKTKAVFYYTADERIDFRQLIRVLADEFKVRIEMRQIGSRQEAGRLGGIGSCGRELCCSTWLTDFRSVSTGAARYQQLSLNPMKLAGQCGKLKCCLNYELDSYMDAIRDFPNVTNVKLETEKGKAFHQKTDIFSRTMFFSYVSEPENFVGLSVDRVTQILELNKEGKKPDALLVQSIALPVAKKLDYENVVGQDSLTRFDKSKKTKRKPKKKTPNSNSSPRGEVPKAINKQQNSPKIEASNS